MADYRSVDKGVLADTKAKSLVKGRYVSSLEINRFTFGSTTAA